MLSHPVPPAPFGIPSILSQGFQVSRASLFPVSLQHRVQGHLLSKEASPRARAQAGTLSRERQRLLPSNTPLPCGQRTRPGGGAWISSRVQAECWAASLAAGWRELCPSSPLLLLEFGAWSLLRASKSFHLLELLILLRKVVCPPHRIAVRIK